MLPPQLQQTLRHRSLSTASSFVLRASASSILRGTTNHVQARGFWAGRQPRDYDSRSDPIFHRFCRYRTLKTRAKLLDKLRRRGRWEWDVNQRPFFSPRHIRLASHIGRPGWRTPEDSRQSKDNNDNANDDGLELSQREKEWKDKMEAMRRRIEQDPYEAIFGKRFEPFWSPLVPSWMREEMGLNRWPKQSRDTTSTNDVDKSSTPKHTSAAPPDAPDQPVSPMGPVRKEQPKKTNNENESESPPNGQLTNYSYNSKKSMVDADPDSPNGQLTNYSYSSSTSWDSWTQKTRREEWDSISGQTRRYEYDPISNRMVQITVDLGSADAQQAKFPVSNSTRILSDSQSQVRSEPTSKPEEELEPSLENPINSQTDETPVKTSSTTMAAKSSPMHTTIPARTERKTSVYFPSLLNTSVVPNPVKPSALTKVPEKELDILTADEVRASVGKTKQERGASDRIQGTLSQARAYRNGKPDPSKSEWDQAETHVMLDREMNVLMRKKQKLLNDEHSLFHIERQKNELRKLDDRIGKISKQLRHATPEMKTKDPAMHTLNSFTETRKQLMSKYNIQPKLETALDRNLKGEIEAKPPKQVSSPSLLSFIDRTASKELLEAVEPDDSAAHESTGDPVNYKPTNVPKEWERQADLLQTDRIRRTLGTDVHPVGDAKQSPNKRSLAVRHRWIDVMNSRKAAYEAQQAQNRAVTEARGVEKNTKLQKANAMLEAEIEKQKFLMQSYEDRYAHKIQSLRQELEIAFKQSSTNSEMHVDRIRNLEQELEKAQKAVGDATTLSRFQSERERFQKKIVDLRTELDAAYKQSSASSDTQVERIQFLENELEKAQKDGSVTSLREKERYMQKIKALRDELDIAFKQSAVQGEKHVESIRQLEKELESIRNQTTPVSKFGAEAELAEGDISADAARYAKDNSKWYKQPLHRPEATGKPTAEEIEKAARRLRDKALIKEVRDIYEGRYGTIDVNHRQGQPQPEHDMKEAPRVVEIETDVDLGKALADYEKEPTSQYQKDGLEAEIATQEQEAHEAQALMAEASAGKMRQCVANNIILDQDVHGNRIVDDAAPKLIQTEWAAHNGTESTATAGKHNIEWAEPPVYKVLAYDSGNDLFSVATTSSNFTGKEIPISIPEALSQLYQPARFVPHFAELQTEGYQVIYGTKDLLVFKKVKTTLDCATNVKPAPTLEDHGLIRTNPIDGTTRSVESNTGSFASPTGFVGDNWDSVERKAQSSSIVTNSAAEAEYSSTMPKSPHENYSQPADEAVEMDIKHFPRVKREERVFSGGRLKQKRERRRHHHEPTQTQVREWRRKWKSYRNRMRWALGVGLGASVVAYAVGAAAEKTERKEKERWEQILEGRRARWE